MKPITELSIDDISAMSEVELKEYEDGMLSRKGEISLELNSLLDKYHNLCMVCKAHGIGYPDFQKEAYGIKQEIDALKKELITVQERFVELQRDWGRLHGTNQVRKILRTDHVTGRMDLGR